MFHLRVTYPTLSRDEIFTRYVGSLFSQPYIYCYEEATSKHIHCFGSLSLSESQTRRRLKSEGLEKYCYSLSKQKDTLEKNLAYIIKDGDYSNSGFPQSAINSAILYNTSIQNDIQEKKKKGTDHSQIILLIEKDLLFESGTSYLRHLVSQYFSDKYKSDGKMVRKYHILSTYDTICIHCFGKMPIESMLEKYTSLN